jgi:hypothetical protein
MAKAGDEYNDYGDNQRRIPATIVSPKPKYNFDVTVMISDEELKRIITDAVEAQTGQKVTSVYYSIEKNYDYHNDYTPYFAGAKVTLGAKK